MSEIPFRVNDWVYNEHARTYKYARMAKNVRAWFPTVRYRATNGKIVWNEWRRDHIELVEDSQVPPDIVETIHPLRTAKCLAKNIFMLQPIFTV